MNPASEEQITLTDVKSFVDGNIVTARREEIRCGDGRTTPEQSNGAIRVFGGDYGVVLAITGAMMEAEEAGGIDPGRVVGVYYDAVKPERGEDAKLFMHTDEHAQEEGGIGCGHAKLSQGENEQEYIVPGDVAASLHQAILDRPEVDIQVLQGSHNEQGALLVYSEKDEEGNRRSVNSVGADGKGSYFVVDMDGIKDHFELVVPRIAGALGIELTAEQVMSAYERQQSASAQVLAFSKGLEAYKVTIDSSGTASIEKA